MKREKEAVNYLPDRVANSHCDYCHPGVDAAAGFEQAFVKGRTVSCTSNHKQLASAG